MKNRTSKGFTLLELLLSMTISVIIVVMIFGIFRVGIRAWEKGENETEAQQRLRIVSELVKIQLRSIAAGSPIIKKNDLLEEFDGETLHMAFVSHIALTPKNKDQKVLVQYQIEQSGEGASLYFSEMPLVGKIEPIDFHGAGDNERHRMLSNMTSISFHYLERTTEDEADPQWQPVWESNNEARLPMAVKIQIVPPRIDMPINIIVPL